MEEEEEYKRNGVKGLFEGWTSVDGYLTCLETNGVVTNVAMLVPQVRVVSLFLPDSAFKGAWSKTDHKARRPVGEVRVRLMPGKPTHVRGRQYQSSTQPSSDGRDEAASAGRYQTGRHRHVKVCI